MPKPPNTAKRHSIAGRPSATPLLRSEQMMAHELGQLFERVPRMGLLSLDCFDTVLWRRTASPVDVFFDLQRHPLFVEHDINAEIRAKAEAGARQLRWARGEGNEVTLADIYRQALPKAEEPVLAALAEAELAAEMKACQAFPGAVDLLLEAVRRGIPVMIVSDTYFTQDQLTALLAHCLPAAAFAAIGRVVVSSEHGVSKAGGLFKRLLERLPRRASEIVHVGDNEQADRVAAIAAGMHAVHLVHLPVAVESQERMQAMALGLADADIRRRRSLARPYHGVLAGRPYEKDSATSIGYVTLGPIMHAFGRWILREIETLKATCTSVRPIFLMRDAWLPMQACEAIAGSVPGAPVRISRFAAFASSFRSAADIERYLAEFANPDYFEAVCKQLLLPESDSVALIRSARADRDPARRFLRDCLRPERVEHIVKASRDYFQTLLAHLRDTAGIMPGDTLVFIDLGYQGTAQRVLTPVMREECGIEVQGRYLLAARVRDWAQSRRGLIDPSWCDDRTLMAVVRHVALLETLCTSDDASVIAYDAQGQAILDAQLTGQAQQLRVSAIQDEAIRFVRDAELYFARCGEPEHEALRDAALGELVRMVYFPTPLENRTLGGFALDMNLATDKTVLVHDLEAGLQGLRERGLFYMENNLETMRLVQPAELHAAGVELSVSLLAQQRFGLEIALRDTTQRVHPLKGILMRGDEVSQDVFEARHTYDGWFSVHVPVGTGDVTAGLLFGQDLVHVQIGSAALIPVKRLFGNTESQHAVSVTDRLIFDGMNALGGGLYGCDRPESLVMVPPCPVDAAERWVARIVYRPISFRQPQG